MRLSHLLFILVAIGLLSLKVNAQEKSSELFTGSRSDTKATAYIFKTPHAKTLGRATFPVYVDEKLIAKLDGERYFVMLLEPGMHVVRSKSKKAGGVEIDMKAGQAYFFRMFTSADITIGSPRFALVPNEEGSFTLKQQKPIKEGDIKDSSLVVMELVERKKR